MLLARTVVMLGSLMLATHSAALSPAASPTA
jgi:hypothetical protein